jgi:transcriptional regulator with XRE-family HTH domain
MISKAELGRRIREARSQKGMTLKQLDQSSGFSATHISEIERGKTSPTIGALIRIANALGKEPSYFIEEELLPEIALTPRDKRDPVSIKGIEGEYLTPGIPGGRLHSCLLRLRPGGPSLNLPAGDCEEGGYVIGGEVEFTVDGTPWLLKEGDAIHHASDLAREVKAVGDGPAEILLVSTQRLKSEGESGV